jgi:hypothetical protein
MAKRRKARRDSRIVMKAVRQRAALAGQPHATIQSSRGEDGAHEQSASAQSGTQFRAVRPNPAQAPARGDPVLDSAKLEGLRFELDVGIWLGDSELIAQRLIDDAEPASVETCDE